MAENARMLADKGIRHFKIKVHNEVEEDVACVNAIRAGGASDIDANQSYAPKDEIRALKAESRIDLAEQPLKANDLIGLKSGNAGRADHD